MEIREKLPEELRPHERDLYEIVREGLAIFISRFGDLRAGMTTRSERSNIHDCIVEAAKKRLPWMFQTKHNLFLIKLGQYRFKLKKLDENLRSSNHPTQMVFDWLRQLKTLFDVSTINLHLGYQPNGIDLRQSSIWIVCPSGGKIEWAYELREAASSSPIPTPMQTPNTPEAPRVKPKVVPFTLPNVSERKE